VSSLRDILNDIYEERGELTPEAVVEEARDPAHPLHTRFEWDDQKAAHSYRLIQAERLIRKVKLYREPDDPRDPTDVRAWVTVRDGTGYHPFEKIAQDPVKSEILLRDAEREWRMLHDRYGHLREFVDIVRRDVSAVEVVAA
jgi:hypothetical protein